MRPGNDPPRDLADRMIRQALRHPDNLSAFLRQAVPELADRFDCARHRLLDREFQMDDWRRREADLPFEIPYRLGDDEMWALVFVILEHQSAEDPAMPLRLLFFVVLYWERQWREWERREAPRPPLRLSPVLPLVLYTGVGPWQNNRTLHDLLDEPAEFHGFVPQWGPLFWELGERGADELLQSGDEWQGTLAVLRSLGEEGPAFQRVYEEAMRRLTSLGDQVRWYDLMRVIMSCGLWRRPREERPALMAAAAAAQADAKRQKEVILMGQSIAEEIWEEGRLTGRSEGGVELSRRMVRQVLTTRFGTVPEGVGRRIDGCADLDRLIAAHQQALTVEKPEDLQF